MTIVAKHVGGAEIGQPAERINRKFLKPGHTHAGLPENDLKERPNTHQAKEDHHDDVVYLGDAGIKLDQAVIHTIPTFLLVRLSINACGIRIGAPTRIPQGYLSILLCDIMRWNA